MAQAAVILRLRLQALALAASLAACSDEPTLLVLDITPGHETDAFSQAPAITRVDVTGSTPEGDIAVGASSAPGGSFDLGEVPEDRLLQFEVTGFDAAGAVAVRGRSLGVVLGAVESEALPIFAQRLTTWSRPPGEMDHAHVAGVAGVLGERYLLSTGGQVVGAAGPDGTAPAYYDLLALGEATAEAFPRAAASLLMGADGATALIVDDRGASWIDFANGTSSDVVLPQGLASFADVAGGAVVTAQDGTVYLVGATRTAEPPTDAVLVWPPGGTLSVARLAYPRHRAAAVWLPDVGLAVAGGSDTAPGLEVLAAGTLTASARAFEPDPTRGAGAIARGGGQLILLGGYDDAGAASSRAVDSTCLTDCEPQLLPIDVPARLGSCRAFAVSADEVLLVGADQDDPIDVGSSAAGMTRTFSVRLVAETIEEIPLREPRAGAAPVATPHGLLALVGGVHPDGTAALTVELFFPGAV